MADLDPAVRARLSGVGLVPMFERATAFAAFQKRDFALAEHLFRLAKFEPE